MQQAIQPVSCMHVSVIRRAKVREGLLPSDETLDAMSNSVFMMIGPKGPIYEVAPDAMKAIEGPNSYQFILHAALDMVDEVEWATPTLFLKTIDKFEDKSISAYVTQGGVYSC